MPTLADEQFKSTYESRYSTARVTPGGYVHNMTTHHEHRGAGHGSALLGEITADADRLGKPLSLSAREALHPWYGRHGFEPTGDEAFGQPVLARKPR